MLSINERENVATDAAPVDAAHLAPDDEERHHCRDGVGGGEGQRQAAGSDDADEKEGESHVEGILQQVQEEAVLVSRMDWRALMHSR